MENETNTNMVYSMTGNTNSKRWQTNSDGWVSTMNMSKENKEEYRKYLKTVKIPEALTYRAWLREIKEYNE